MFYVSKTPPPADMTREQSEVNTWLFFNKSGYDVLFQSYHLALRQRITDAILADVRGDNLSDNSCRRRVEDRIRGIVDAYWQEMRQLQEAEPKGVWQRLRRLLG